MIKLYKHEEKIDKEFANIYKQLNNQPVSETVQAEVKGDKGDKGDKGEPGNDGYTPVKGVDYFDGIDGTDGTDGNDGASAYVYIAYADDASGGGFTNTFDTSKNFIAIKKTTSPIASPVASDFTGLWKNYKGATGATGPSGSANELAEIPIRAISGLFAWWDASDNSTLHTVNYADQAVTNWFDKAYAVFPGNELRHNTQPAYPTVEVRSLKIYHAINFAGGQFYFVYNSLNSFLNMFSGNNKPISFFAVLRPSAFTTYKDLFVLSGSGNPYIIIRIADNGNNRLSIFRRSDSAASASANGTHAFQNDTPVLVECILSGTDVTAYINGTVEIATTAMNVGTSTFTSATVSSSSSPLTSKIYEMIIFTTALNTSDRQAVESYLNTKWNIY